MEKFYAVKKGRKTGIFESWEECSKAVSGFSGAEYKSFKDKNLAKEYLKNKKEEFKKDNFSATAYVDGSFNKETKTCGFGAVITYGDTQQELLGSGCDKSAAELRNVYGEMMGAVMAVKYAIKIGAKSVLIVHDYTGISCWAEGSWDAKTDATKKYKKFMNEKQNEIEIYFKKVKAHSGIEQNERADKLAKIAVGIDIEKNDLDILTECFVKENIKNQKFDIIDLFFERYGQLDCKEVQEILESKIDEHKKD